MKTGNYYLKKKIADYGCFIDISVEIDELESNQAIVNLKFDNEDFVKYLYVFEFGKHYLIERLKRRSYIGQLNIRITNLDSYIIDTTSVIILYGFLKAVESALSLSLSEDIFIDENNCNFCFLK